MRRLLYALLFTISATPAWAQCSGVFPASTVCGNLTGSPNTPSAVPFGGTIIGPGSTTNNGLVLWGNALGTQLKDGAGQTIAGNYIWSGNHTFNGTANFTSTFQISGNAITWPGVAGSVAFIGVANTWTGAQTFNAATTIFNSGMTDFAGAINGSQVGDLNTVTFTPPNFGGTWLTNGYLVSSYSTTHADSRTTFLFNRTATGSGTTGPGTADYGLYVTASKTNFLSSVIDGEIDGLSITVAQGSKGDSAPLLAIAQKVYGGTGGVVGSEFTGRWIDTSGNALMVIQAIPSFGEAAGGPSSNTGYGMWIENQGATHSVAASQITPWSGLYIGAFDLNGNCPAHCPTFTNFLTAAANRTTAHIFFQVAWGLNESGTITIGSPNATGVDGTTATLSGGSPVTISNVGGNINLTPKVGGNISIAGTAGVTCAGAPTGAFASTAGIVTHC